MTAATGGGELRYTSSNRRYIRKKKKIILLMLNADVKKAYLEIGSTKSQRIVVVPLATGSLHKDN